MKAMPPIYIYIVLALFVLNAIALVEPIQKILTEPAKSDDVVDLERKLQEIKPLVPAKAVVGYVADGEVAKKGKIRLEDCRLFYMTQYSMAPNIVMHETKRDLVIGNFSSHEVAIQSAKQLGLPVIKDCGNGIMLLKGNSTK